MQAKSFIEILEDEIRAEIRADLRRELEQELRARNAPKNTQAIHAAGRLETWLASHVGPVVFKTARQPYGAPPKRTPPPPVTFSAETTEETIAAELLSRHAGHALPSQYTTDDLKTVWRKAALKSHPDRFAGADSVTVMRATALFRELAAAYELLSTKTAAVAA